VQISWIRWVDVTIMTVEWVSVRARSTPVDVSELFEQSESD